jgi:hypothetical protein
MGDLSEYGLVKFSNLIGTGIAINVVILAVYSIFVLIGNLKRHIRKSLFAFYLEVLLFAIPLCAAGMVSGYVAGISRIPAVTSLLPASLSFISAIFLLVYTAKNKEQVLNISCCILIFCVALFSGTVIGSDNRESGRVARLKLLSEQEVKIRLYRKNRNLDPEFPSWMLTGEGPYK